MKRSREEPIPRAKYLRERGWKKVPGTSRFGAAYWKDPRDPRISCIESLAVDEQRARDALAVAGHDGWQNLEVEVSRPAHVVLEELRRTGLFGFRVEDVASRLLHEKLREYIEVRKIKL